MAATQEKEKDFKYLVIVESPAKSKTLTKILGGDYLVKSSIGHIRDLPDKGLGIDVKDDFKPSYEIMSGKQKVVSELQQYAKKAQKVYLASDPDREGEAIAWHLSQVLDCKASQITRVAFNQITPDAVKNAVASPRDINIGLVNAQQARRILDRLVGYKISPILWRKIGGRSAGRVQSIAVRLICEREDEILAFTPEEYWTLNLDVNAANKKPNFNVRLVNLDGKRVSTPLDDKNKNKVISSQAEMQSVTDRIKESSLSVASISSRPSSKKAQPPFKTSTLQRAASSALGYSVKKTMQVAQTLYEGVKLSSGDQVGLITYMRTDSLRIAPEAIEMAKEYIVEKFGANYYPETPNIYGKVKKANEQDAHEAIRPTYIDKTPESIKAYLSDDQYKVYKLIWQRFLASQMVPTKLEIKTVEIESSKKDILVRASQSKKVFAGYSIVYDGHTEIDEDAEAEEIDSIFPDNLAEDDKVSVVKSNPAQHFTEGPPRFNEASLVKTLEELGIGRPSTYAPTINTIQDRKYVEKVDNSNALRPTKLGMQVNRLLVDHFGKYINVEFTSQMESSLDSVAEENQDWVTMIKEFYLGKDWKIKEKQQVKKGKKKKSDDSEKSSEPVQSNLDDGFIDIVKKASEEIANVTIATEHQCPTCTAPMLLKSSRFGPFLGCSKYPECQTIVNLTKEGKPAPEDRPFTEEDCTECKAKSSLVIRYGRYGDYIACTTETCKYVSPLQKKIGVKCSKEGCSGDIIEKKSRFGKIFYGCSAWSKTKCDSTFWYPPIDLKCPECSKLMMYKTLKRGDKLACSDVKGCGYARDVSPKDIEMYRPKVSAAQAAAEKSVFSL
ncbi:MAG: type I DNA topoisomerase [Candidatus Caenarcaniphilales bacterium]|jgi:DNA topoisomerase-1|nr:type I DNA topoisomerase [Candidatus Caenarcaniphilales bacterium]